MVSEPHSTAARILDAAGEAFAELGYDAASVAEIARRVGVVEGAIYRHFTSKRDLLHQVIRGFYEPLIASAVGGIAGIDSPTARLRFLVWRQLTAMTEDRLLCRLVISEARSLDYYYYYESEVAELNRRYTSLAVDAIADGIAAGEFRDDLPPAVIRDVLYGSIEHLAWGALAGYAELDVDATTDQLMALVRDGIRADARSDGLAAQVDRLESLLSRMEPAT